jgi:predicted unusual protein kinase regulating ubiquinone biosynthesis (AarF/ABC1/UbiB family)
MGFDKVIPEDERPSPSFSPGAEELPRDLERLGPAYVKLGQFLSTRSDLLPPRYMDALARLQDNLNPFPYDQVEKILHRELGKHVREAFLDFDRVPIAAASLAQVHRARLPDGREVAVKVQRPHIHERIIRDLDAFEDVAEFLDRHTPAGRRYMLRATLDEFRKAVLRELDFRQEAGNLAVFRENLKEFSLIVIPRPVGTCTTSRILTMDYIEGEKIIGLTPSRRVEINGSRLAEELFRAYLHQILLDGFYHADPHPGNVILTRENRIGLLDLGMVARLSEDIQRRLLRLLLAVGEGRSAEAVEYAMELGDRLEEFNEREFARKVKELVMRHQQTTIGEIEVGRVVLEVFKIAGDSGIRFPAEMTLLGKSLLNLDHIGRSLEPSFDPNAAIRKYAGHLFRSKLRGSMSAASAYEFLMDSGELIQYMPKRVNKILTDLANKELVIRTEAFDEKYLMMGIQKIANRLTAGVVLAAIIVGAALVMNVDTPFKIYGYPVISIVLFLLAAIGGLALVISILFHDERNSKRHDH